jgi:hypothetical protein
MAEGLLAGLGNDPFLAPFLAPGFDADLYTRSAVRTVRPLLP